jgi:hypothetical protein
LNLTVADGFKFGCGLTLAAAFAIMLLLLFVALAAFAANAMGINLPVRPGL